MARIGKHQLEDMQLSGLFLQMYNALGTASSKQVAELLGELLGPEEQIMLAKRLASIVMLSEGKSVYKTALILKISTATADKIQGRISNGDYRKLLNFLKKDKVKYLTLLETLDSILHLGGILPHRVGMDRYKGIIKNLSID